MWSTLQSHEVVEGFSKRELRRHSSITFIFVYFLITANIFEPLQDTTHIKIRQGFDHQLRYISFHTYIYLTVKEWQRTGIGRERKSLLHSGKGSDLIATSGSQWFSKIWVSGGRELDYTRNGFTTNGVPGAVDTWPWEVQEVTLGGDLKWNWVDPSWSSE